MTIEPPTERELSPLIITERAIEVLRVLNGTAWDEAKDILTVASMITRRFLSGGKIIVPPPPVSGAPLDGVSQWFFARCLPAPDYWTENRELYGDYANWARSTGAFVLSERIFGVRLTNLASDRLFRKVHHGTGRTGILGLRLVDGPAPAGFG